MNSLTFEIEGLHCQSCKMLINEILNDEGVRVRSFDVDLKKQVGKIVADTKLAPSKIVALITGAGEYKITQK